MSNFEFSSLRCPTCDAPFSPDQSSANFPAYIGSRMRCMGCWLHPTKFQYSLTSLEILKSESLELSPDGYQAKDLLTDPISVPKCPICKEDYSDDHIPILIPCKHTVCSKCCKMRGTLENIEATNEFVDCPLCSKKVVLISYRGDLLVSKFAKEVSTLLRQQKDVLETRKLELATEERRKNIEKQILKYENHFPELNKEIQAKLRDIAFKMMEKVDELKNFRGDDWRRGDEQCERFGESFEKISTEYLQNLRSFGQKLKELSDEIERDEKKRKDMIAT